jgi:imidazolonepropionase-like amidohydrolase
MRRIVIGFVLVALYSTISASQAPRAGATLYEGARLILGDSRAPIEDGAFLVDNGRFTEVGRKGQLKAAAGATRVDLTGKTVIPAIVDTHTHMSSMRDELKDQLERKAFYGTGVVMSLGQDSGDLALQVRAEGFPGAARLRTAGRGITAPEPGRSDVPYWITTAAEGRKAVDEQAARKVDIIKIWVDDRDGKYKKLTPELYTAIIDEAHKQKVRVTAHIFTLEDAKGLLRAGIDAFAHGVRDRDIDQEFLDMMKQRPNFVLVPNLPDRGVAVDMSWLSDSVPPAELKKLQAGATNRPEVQQTFGIQARNLAKLNAAGVKIALGTDGAIPYSAHLEMEDMVAAGMTPAQVLVAATGTAAEFLRMNDVGTLAAGKSADFVVLDANPLTDIKNTRKIASVYLRGTAVDRTALRGRWMKAATN